MKNCASEYEKINEENKEENDADKSRQQCFKSLKKYAATKKKKKRGGVSFYGWPLLLIITMS